MNLAKFSRRLLPLVLAAMAIVFSSCENDITEIIDETVIETVCTGTSSTFMINLNPNECGVNIQSALGEKSQYQESVNGTIRNIVINGIASHNVGNFPNPGNPNTISVQSSAYSITTTPTMASSSTRAQGYEFGVLFSGVSVDPFTAEFFRTSTGGFNMEWNITTLTSAVNLGLDCNNAHVQPTGKYHYHGTPSAFVDEMGIDGSKMVKVGYAADGFPIYYKYVIADDGSSILEMKSSYQLKEGSRNGDGKTAPDGCYDGTYFQDYEYVSGLSELDECNGRFGATPDKVEGEYYYVMTDNFPSSPLCFSGTPNTSFRLGPR